MRSNLLVRTTIVLVLLVTNLSAQQKPGIAYMFPSGGTAGTTVDVVLGGYDWTPDMQVFARDPRIKLEIVGVPSPVIVPEPPYWFGKKARRGPFPLPREFPAKLSLPANIPAGEYQWQAANANGATTSGTFIVSHLPEIVEVANRREPQQIAKLPTIISGRILKIEQVDRYRFTAAKTGPVTCSLVAAGIKSPLTAIVEIRDINGRMVADAADTQGRDLDMTFSAVQGQEYVVSVYDSDYRGNRAYVYRLSIANAPRVVVTIPAAIGHGKTQSVELVGYGIKSGRPVLESVTKPITAPATGDAMDYQLQTPFGDCGVRILLSQASDRVETANESSTKYSTPLAVTGRLGTRFEEDLYRIVGKKGDTWSIAVQAKQIGSPLDVSMTLSAEDGRVLIELDDLKDSTDIWLEYPIPADGVYELNISDHSGKAGNAAATYRLSVELAKPGFKLTFPEFVDVLVGGKAALTISARRFGTFQGEIPIQLKGLPAGVTIPDKLVIAEKQKSVKVEFTVAKDAGTTAALLELSASAVIDGKPERQVLDPVLLAITMKPPFTVTAEGKDDVTKWPRGTTFPGPVLIQRDETFKGEIVLEMHSRQGRHRQGISGPELTVAPGVQRALYPVFLPEWLETTRTSRMVVNGVAKVPDPKGRVRYLSSKLKTRIGFLPVGALLKASCPLKELAVTGREAFEVPIVVNRVRELSESATLTLRLPEELDGKLTSDPIVLDPMTNDAIVRIQPAPSAKLSGEHQLTFRVTVMQDGQYPVISEAHLTVVFTDTNVK